MDSPVRTEEEIPRASAGLLGGKSATSGIILRAARPCHERAGVGRAGVGRVGIERAGVGRAGVGRAGVGRVEVERAGVGRVTNDNSTGKSSRG